MRAGHLHGRQIFAGRLLARQPQRGQNHRSRVRLGGRCLRRVVCPSAIGVDPRDQPGGRFARLLLGSAVPQGRHGQGRGIAVLAGEGDGVGRRAGGPGVRPVGSEPAVCALLPLQPAQRRFRDVAPGPLQREDRQRLPVHTVVGGVPGAVQPGVVGESRAGRQQDGSGRGTDDQGFADHTYSFVQAVRTDQCTCDRTPAVRNLDRYRAASTCQVLRLSLREEGTRLRDSAGFSPDFPWFQVVTRGGCPTASEPCRATLGALTLGVVDGRTVSLLVGDAPQRA